MKPRLADLRRPHEWWEKTRKLNRNFHLHLGPTNSGKTHDALVMLKKSKRGVYCGPLRLLASEVFEKLNSEGIRCSLITGQETKIVRNSSHLACTTESLKLTEEYDCAVIDEIQMIESQERGSAWTNAVLGLMANEIHLTGEKRAKGIIESLLQRTGDTITEYSYSRMSSLDIISPITSLSQLKPGDCLVTFSRKSCHALKNHIEKKQPGSCAIIYGNLPPEVRRSQAEKFNNQQYKYLIATDAIGMGLNYNINRVIFMETKKRDKLGRRDLLPHEIKQIAGRAGRNMREGFVTGCDMQSWTHLQKSFNFGLEETIKKAGLFPNYEQLIEFAENYYDTIEGISYSTLLVQFSKLAILENIYFLESIKETCVVANALKSIGLSLQEMHIFCKAPVKLDNPFSLSILKRYANEYKSYKLVKSFIVDEIEDYSLEKLENIYSVNQMYLSLSKKFESDVFADTEVAKIYLEKISEAIQNRLSQQTLELIESKLDID